MMKAACFSVAVMDYFPQQDAYYPGGNSLNQANMLRASGLDTAFIGAVGKDDAGDRLYNLLNGYNVDVSRLHRVEGNTARNEITNDKFGERFGVEGKWKGGVYETYRMDEQDWEYIAGCDLVVTHANCPDFEEFLNRSRPDQFVAVDFLHLEDFDVLKRGRNKDVVDILFSGGHSGMIPELKKLSGNSDCLIVLTLGKDGSMAFQNGKVIRQDALPVDTVVDTTGCGDAFQAAFTCEYVRSSDIEEALFKGAQAGRELARRYGAAQWL